MHNLSSDKAAKNMNKLPASLTPEPLTSMSTARENYIDKFDASTAADEAALLQHHGAFPTSACVLHIRGGAGDHESKTVEPDETRSVPETLVLRDWMVQYSLIHRGRRGSSSLVDKHYLQKATRIALSLATILQSQQDVTDSNGFMPENEICADNVTVTTTVDEDVEADFVQKTILPRYGWGAASYSQRIAICALGRLFFELFTLGEKPPQKDPNKTLTSVAPLSMDYVQKLIDEQKNGDSQNSAKKQAREEEKNDAEGAPYTLLLNAGLPHAICRLVSDMLENTGGLFSHDNSVATFSDVKQDLSQMVEKPTLFLHNALVMRKPIVPTKLYCRDNALKQFFDVAKQVVESDSVFDRHSRSAIMLSGCSGSGKSRLVQEVSSQLEQKGWQYLYCKFDQAEGSRPLRNITSAIDRFLLDLTFEGDGGEEVRSRIATAFNEEDLSNLLDVIPTLRHLISHDSNIPASLDDIFDEESYTSPPKISPVDVSHALESNFRLYRSCAMLLKAISSTSHPLIFCMDDLQWSDTTSVDLIYSLLVHVDQNVNEESRIMLVGCYRTYEDCPVAEKIKDIFTCSRVTLTNITLEALSPDDVNLVISDALSYPRRLTRPLANLIAQKTTGNPLFIKEFLNSLAAENLLTFSLPRQAWEWDEELIQIKTVSDNVAKLLTRKLLRLSEHVLSSLRIMSCFGAEVQDKVLIHVRDACGNPDIIMGLEYAATESLVEKTKRSFRFSHDMIQQTVYNSIELNARQNMLIELAEILLKKSAGGKDDAVLFIIAQFVNRVGPNFITSAEKRARYAGINLQAGERASQVPDFNSVCEYVENGIKFLGDDNWKDEHYHLSLALFKNAAIAQWSLGNTTIMSEHIHEVCNKGRVFEDKLEVMDVLIHSLGMDGCSASRSIEHCTSVLMHLGEVFQSPIENDYIVKELSETNKCLIDLPTNPDEMSINGHPLKVQAMNFLYLLLYFSHQQKHKIFPLAACRMVKLTLEFGLHEYSSVGIAGMALSYYTVFADVETAYKLGKVAVDMAKSQGQTCFPEVSSIVHGMINVWREPLQVVLPPLLESYKVAKAGKTTTALVNAMLYTYRAYFAGSSLPQLHTDMVDFLQLMARHKRIALYLLMMPVSNAIGSFCGGAAHEVWEGIGQCKDDDENSKMAVEHKELTLYDCIVAMKMMRCFIFRELDDAKNLVTDYQKLMQANEGHGRIVHLATAYTSFYSGMIAWHFFRETLDRYWINIGNDAIEKMRSWSSQCSWNFSNKLLLLQAESHYSLGEEKLAAEKYSQAIESARKHRFVHEEAMGCELASLFHQKMNDQDLSSSLMKRSIDCYTTWGAQKKVEALKAR